MKERSIAFGPGDALIGTLCLPEAARESPATLGVIAFNAGVVHRVGSHRINVRLARRLAARGIPSIRFDLSGQGDSARLPSAGGYLEQAVVELRHAIDALVAEAGVSQVVLFGICSGGVHSFAAAQRDERIAGAILYDTYIYPTVRSRVNRYLLKLRHKPAATLVSDLARKIAVALGRRAPGAGVKAGAGTGGFATPPAEAFADTVRKLHARGTRIAMIYSGAFEEYNYAEQFRDRFDALGLAGLVSSEFLPQLGHTATRLADQALLLDRIEAWIGTFDAGPGRGGRR